MVYNIFIIPIIGICFQLNIYKYILEKKYNKIVKDLPFVFHPENECNNYEKIKLPILPENDILCLLNK